MNSSMHGWSVDALNFGFVHNIHIFSTKECEIISYFMNSSFKSGIFFSAMSPYNYEYQKPFHSTKLVTTSTSKGG